MLSVTVRRMDKVTNTYVLPSWPDDITVSLLAIWCKVWWNLTFTLYLAGTSFVVIDLTTVVAALSSLPFSCQFFSSFLLASNHNFLAFWRRNIETASTATALEMINLHKCIQLFVNRTFNCISKPDDVCGQIAFLKHDGSWGHTPLTENTLCKISSLALRCSATNVLSQANTHGCLQQENLASGD